MTEALRPGAAMPSGALGRAWRAYCLVVGACGALALLLAILLLAAGVNIFPFAQLVLPRTVFTLFVFVYLVAMVAGVGRSFEVLAVTLTPFLAHFYQVALGRDFPHGASLVRMLPYLVMALTMSIAVPQRRWRPDARHLLMFAALVFVSIAGWLNGMDLTSAGTGAVFYVALLLPLFYAYVQGLACAGGDRLNQLLLALTVGTFLLILGFFVTYQLGLRVQTVHGLGSVDSARNVADFNALAPSLLLMWPFALAFTVPRSRVLVGLLFILFAAGVFAGLSRTMLFLTPLLIAVSLPACVRRITFKGAVSAVAALVLLAVVVVWSLDALGQTPVMVDLWQRRLNLDTLDLRSLTLAELVSSIAPGSFAQEYRALIRQQGWEMFLAHPFLGQGWDTYRFFSRVEQSSAHSLSVDTLAQAGLVGFAVLWVCILVALWTVLSGFLQRRQDPRVRLVFLASCGLWLVAAHTLGAELFVVAEESFTTGAIGGLILVLYLTRPVVDHAALKLRYM